MTAKAVTGMTFFPPWDACENESMLTGHWHCWRSRHFEQVVCYAGSSHWYMSPRSGAMLDKCCRLQLCQSAGLPQCAGWCARRKPGLNASIACWSAAAIFFGGMRRRVWIDDQAPVIRTVLDLGNAMSYVRYLPLVCCISTLCHSSESKHQVHV
jgi:hypothetical protein